MKDQKDFMEAQIHRIEIDKWVQGERQHSDPGNRFVMDWVYENAKEFRDDWNMSVCKTCSFHRECGYYAKSECERYLEMEEIDEENIMP